MVVTLDSLDSIEENHLEEKDLEKTKESWTTFNGEKPLEPKNEEFMLCLSSNSLCVKNTNQQKEEDLNVMVEEDT